MTLDTWLSYCLACALISIIPGPSVMMILGQAIAKGRRAALVCLAGDLIGGIFVMSAAYLGLGFILASSALAFLVLKWLGVVYMAYLGLSQILTARRLTGGDLPQQGSARGSLRAGFLTGILNPKAIMFHMAFLAQFIDPSAPQLPQFLILMVTDISVIALILGSYALMASYVSAQLSNVKARRRMGYAGGSCLLGGSAVMAITR